MGAKIYKSPKWEAEDVTPPALGVPQPVDHPLTPFPVNPDNLQTTGTIPPKPQNYQPIKVDKLLSQARKLVEDEWNLAFADLPALEDYLQSKNLMVPPVKTLVSLYSTIDKWTEDEVREIARMMITDQEEGIDPEQDIRISDALSQIILSKLKDAGYDEWKDTFFTHSEEEGIDETDPYKGVTPVIPETNYPFGDMAVCPICNTEMRRVEWQGREWFTCPIHGPQRAPHRNAPYWKEKDTRSQYQPTKDKGYRPEEISDTSLEESKQAALKNVDDIVESARNGVYSAEECASILNKDIQIYDEMLKTVEDMKLRDVLNEVLKKMQTGVNEIEMMTELREETGVDDLSFEQQKQGAIEDIVNLVEKVRNNPDYANIALGELKMLEEMYSSLLTAMDDVELTPIAEEVLKKIQTGIQQIKMMQELKEEGGIANFVPNPFKCPLCSDSFESKEELDAHAIAHYAGPLQEEKKCPYCGQEIQEGDHHSSQSCEIQRRKKEDGIDVMDEKKIKEIRDLLHMTDDELEDYLKSPGNVDVDQIWGKKYDETLACPKCGKEITVTPPEYKELDDHLRIHEEIESMPEGHPNEPMYSEE